MTASSPAGAVRARQRILGILSVVLLAAGLTAGAPQPTASAVGSQVLLPVADAGVYSGAPNTNYGKSTTARVDNSATASRPWYLRFPAPTVPAGETVTSAKLRFYTLAIPAGYTRGPAVSVADTLSSWGETTLTLANRPAVGTKIKGAAAAGTVGGYTEVPLTGYVGGTISLVVRATDNGSAHVYSREATAGHPPELVVTTAPTEARLVWSDEFNGTTVDTTKWNVRNNWAADNEESIATNRSTNVSVANGALTIRALREQLTTPAGKTRQFTSGYLDTIGKASWTYGRFEIRAKVATQSDTSKGIWPAFWMRPNSGDGEIDIMEAIGSGVGETGTEWKKTHQTIHHDYVPGTSFPQQSHTHTFSAGTPSDGYHVYSVQWDPGVLIWYIDGVEVWRRDTTTTSWFTESFSKPYNLRLNQQVGGTWAGTPDANTTFPADYKVDWVRVYQR